MIPTTLQIRFAGRAPVAKWIVASATAPGSGRGGGDGARGRNPNRSLRSNPVGIGSVRAA
ncbi:hypothetical protein [Natrinema salaciae]|uniref:hypothetical protein n=1 Tax=Natrinema salaciae TaxID=1186196 RepID=UPI000B8A0B92|nr:hypothetical protein [Natrinema salaciae]